MTEGAKMTVELTAAEVALHAEALDSHEYWQLSDPLWRNSGYVILPGEDIEPTPVEPLGEDQRQAVDEILEVRRLQELLRAATS
ncbi:MAG: hypothetical protein GY708_11210 [Actinomycetia bacterium]|nr:hypothetical protein [Actinomycetes bacterium]